MTIKEVKVDEIVPYENNPRKNAEAVEKVANSIREFGFKVPVVLDKENIIVAGHTRIEAAKSLGMESVPAVYADDLTEEQIKAFRLADNKTGELASWDFYKLDIELEELEKHYDATDFGFAEHATLDDSIFGGDEEVAPKEPTKKRYQCPHCGEWVEA